MGVVQCLFLLLLLLLPCVYSACSLCVMLQLLLSLKVRGFEALRAWGMLLRPPVCRVQCGMVWLLSACKLD